MKQIKRKKKILFITLDSFSNSGGIQNVCKNLSFTLNSICQKSQDITFNAVSLYDKYADTKYIDARNFKGHDGNGFSFIKNVIIQGASSDQLIISHIHLLLIALIVKILNRKCSVVLIAHGIEVWRELALWKKVFLNNAASVWSVSKYTKKIMVNRHGLKHEKITVVNNCLDPYFRASTKLVKPQELLQQYCLTANQRIILTVCRFSKFDRDKGYFTILNILPDLLIEFPDLHYFMVGKAEPFELAGLKNRINQLGLQAHVTLTGFISDVQLTRHYLLSDVFVLPSKKEGFGLVFIEAASWGCRVISGNQDGSEEALLNGRLGDTVDVGDPLQIKLLITNCLRRDRSVRSKRNTQNLCLKHFHQRKYQTKIKELIK